MFWRNWYCCCRPPLRYYQGPYPNNLNPFSVLNVARLQTQNPKNPIYTGMSDCIKKTLKWEGVGGLYKGFISPLWGKLYSVNAKYR